MAAAARRRPPLQPLLREGDAMTATWTVVAFDHPFEGHSVLYRQGLDEADLLKAVADAVEEGANLMSIRRVDDRES